MRKHKTEPIRILIFQQDESDASGMQMILEDSGLDLEIKSAMKYPEYMKKIISGYPDVVIVSNRITSHSGIEIYQDTRRALPNACFILTHADDVNLHMPEYTLSGIDCFLLSGADPMLPLRVLHGFNKKHLDKIQQDSFHILNEKKLQLRAVFNNNPSAILILDVKGYVLDLNPAASLLLEQPYESLQNTDFNKYLTKDSLKIFRSAFSNAFRGKINSGEFGFTISRTVNKQAECRLVPIRGDENQITSLLLICKDVTEVFQLQKKFRISEERFLAFANHAPVGIFYENTEGNCLYVNNVWCELTGLSYKESLGHGWIRSVHPDDRERIQKFVEEIRKNPKPFVIDYRISDPHGNVKWVTARSSPYIDEKGKLHGYVGTVMNVTNEKNLALGQEQAGTREKISMQLAGLGVVERDLETNNVIWNEEVFTMLELVKNAEVPTLDAFIDEYIHSEDRGKFRTTLGTALLEGGSRQVSFRIRTAGNNIKFIRSAVVLEKNLEGKSVRLVAALQDITGDWEREQLLKENEEQLRYLFNQAPDAIYIEDLDGNILEANEEACRLQGMKKEMLIGKNLADIAPPDVHKEIFANFKKMAQEEIPGLKSFTWNKDGTKIPVLIKQRLIQFRSKPALLLHVRKIEVYP